ncbi:endonuclease domain-containing protein [Bogoriella caseilytica]|nr:DUF559 domain-containing protein [Bogoriella caseilytica]
MGISPGEVTHRGPLAVTTRARTALDCLMDFPRSDAESLMIWVRTREVLTATDLEEAIAARQGHRGVSQLRSLTALTADGALSELEHRLHQLLREAGITGWIANAPVRVGGRIIARADVLFPAANVILEADGREYHQDFEADRRRLNSLTLAGYVVLRLTWRQVTEDPQVVIQQVREALAS